MDSNKRMRNCLILSVLTVAGCLIILCTVYLPKQFKTRDAQDNTVDSGFISKPAVNNIEIETERPVSEKQSPSNEETLDSTTSPGVEFIDSEVLQQADEALGEALFDIKYSDPRKFVKLKWHSGMPYKTARRLIKEDKLPLLYEMLEDKSYAPYWHKVARLIGYISDDPCSVPVLLQYFQRDDSWNWKSVDRTTGIPRLMGKISVLAWIGKNRAGLADIILRQAVTEKSAEKLAADWIGDNLVQGSSTFKSKENVVALIRSSAAKGLVYSGKRENIEIVKKLYAQEDAYCRTNRKTTTLHNGLVEAMAIEDFIREKSLESFLNIENSNYLNVMIPYFTKYSWLLQDLEKKRKTEID